MTPAEKLLKMIEDVDPADSDALDEIDARFWCYKQGATFVSWRNKSLTYKDHPSMAGTVIASNIPYDKVTRSRDALKAARLDGWYFDIECTILNKEWIVDCGTNPEGCSPIMFASPHLSTEELAEIHAIVQVIEWKRDNA